MTPTPTSLDFGYPWWLSHGHLVLFAVALAALFVCYRLRRPRWLQIPLAALTLWSGAAFLVVQFVFNVNDRASLPTASFLTSGAGRVVDLGAGTGRSSIMVLEARPRATLVALDLFADSFEMHFGKSESPRQRLLANLKAAGVEGRATIETGDMRELPFEDASFDAAVSSYAIDHLGREGAKQALAEAARVVKPGGELLLMVVANDAWGTFAFGPLLEHGARGDAWWTERVEEAGFEILETGRRPITLYFLGRRR
jgi:SAM-dependent methyltransferase